MQNWLIGTSHNSKCFLINVLPALTLTFKDTLVWGNTHPCTRGPPGCPAGSHQPSGKHHDSGVQSWSCLCVCVCVSPRQSRGQVFHHKGYVVMQNRSAFVHAGTSMCTLHMYICTWALFICVIMSTSAWVFVTKPEECPRAECGGQMYSAKVIFYNGTAVTHLKLSVRGYPHRPECLYVHTAAAAVGRSGSREMFACASGCEVQIRGFSDWVWMSSRVVKAPTLTNARDSHRIPVSPEKMSQFGEASFRCPAEV